MHVTTSVELYISFLCSFASVCLGSDNGYLKKSATTLSHMTYGYI